MPILLATCPGCGERIEIDLQQAVIMLSDLDARIWRQVRTNHRPGDRVNAQVVADMLSVSAVTVYATLKRLALYGLIQRIKVRRYSHYRVAPPQPQKLKKTA